MVVLKLVKPERITLPSACSLHVHHDPNYLRSNPWQSMYSKTCSVGVSFYNRRGTGLHIKILRATVVNACNDDVDSVCEHGC